MIIIEKFKPTTWGIKFSILCVVALAFCNPAHAQQKPTNKIDTLSAALLLRVANHTLTKSDSAILKQQSGKLLVLNNSQLINVELLMKLASHTLSKAEEESLTKQILQTLKIDTILVKFNKKGLSEQNRKADSLDLKITSCDFEKEANAMILFDLGQMSADMQGIRVTRHKRIKIFNESGKSAANIRIDYTNQFGAEQIEEIEGKTINLNNGKIEYTELDPKLVYHQNTDKYHESVLFSMPNVKAGSVIELAYVWHRTASRNVPGWNFQSEIPTRYSQYIMQLYPDVHFSLLDRRTLPLSRDSVIFDGFGHVWAMTDVPSVKVEPFMRSPGDGVQSIKVTVTSAMSPEGRIVDIADSWYSVGKQLAGDKELSKTFDQKVNDKEGLLKWARMLPTTDAKVNYLFNQVKTLMRWNEERTWASKDGIKKAWENKSGNWGEINMVLCSLLNQADVKAYPMLASTRDNGIMYRNFPDVYQINKLVTYVPESNDRFYVLDASGKFNHCNEVPFDLLNSYGLSIDRANDQYELVLLKNTLPVKQEVSINAEIKADGIAGLIFPFCRVLITIGNALTPLFFNKLYNIRLISPEFPAFLFHACVVVM